MKKYIAVFLIITISFFVVGCGKDEGHWVLVDTKVNTAEWKEVVADVNSRSEAAYDDQIEIEVSENSVFYKDIYTQYPSENFPGETITLSGKFTWDKVPQIVPGTKDGFALNVKAETIERPSDFLDTHYSIGLWTMESEKDLTSYNQFSDKDGNFFIISNKNNDFASVESTFYGTLGEGSSLGESKEVVMDIGFVRFTHIYRWEKL